MKNEESSEAERTTIDDSRFQATALRSSFDLHRTHYKSSDASNMISLVHEAKVSILDDRRVELEYV